MRWLLHERYIAVRWITLWQRSSTCPMTLMVWFAHSQASTASDTRPCFSTTPTSSWRCPSLPHWVINALRSLTLWERRDHWGEGGRVTRKVRKLLDYWVLKGGWMDVNFSQIRGGVGGGCKDLWLGISVAEGGNEAGALSFPPSVGKK